MTSQMTSSKMRIGHIMSLLKKVALASREKVEWKEKVNKYE